MTRTTKKAAAKLNAAISGAIKRFAPPESLTVAKFTAPCIGAGTALFGGVLLLYQKGPVFVCDEITHQFATERIFPR